MDNRIWDKLEKIDDKLGKMVEHQSQLNVSVEYHIKRTDLLEKKVDKFWLNFLMAGAAATAIIEGIHHWIK